MHCNQYRCVKIFQRNYTEYIPSFHSICCLALTTLSLPLNKTVPPPLIVISVQNIGQQIIQYDCIYFCVVVSTHTHKTDSNDNESQK